MKVQAKLMITNLFKTDTKSEFIDAVDLETGSQMKLISPQPSGMVEMQTYQMDAVCKGQVSKTGVYRMSIIQATFKPA